MSKIKHETIIKLIAICQEDKDMLDILYISMKLLEEYCSAIFDMKIRMKVF